MLDQQFTQNTAIPEIVIGSINNKSKLRLFFKYLLSATENIFF